MFGCAKQNKLTPLLFEKTQLVSIPKILLVVFILPTSPKYCATIGRTIEKGEKKKDIWLVEATVSVAEAKEALYQPGDLNH